MVRKAKQRPLDRFFELLREGNMREGAELLYSECYNKVYSIAFSILHDEGKSEDVVHNVVRNIITLKPENAPTDGELRWLYKVTKNEALRYLNAAMPTVSLDEVAPIACEDKSIAEFVDMDAYYSMLKGLDERRKRVVTLKVLGGYTHREIAGITKLPIGTVMWLYNTAVQQLRITLASMLTLILAVGVIFIERLAHFVNEFVISSGPQSPDTTLPWYVNESEVRAAEISYHREVVFLLAELILLVIASTIFILKRYAKRSAKGKAKGIDISVLIAAMLITSFVTTIAAHSINYNENKPELEPVRYTEMKCSIYNQKGDSREDTDTPALNDFKLVVGTEYKIILRAYSYQELEPIFGRLPADIMTFYYDTELMKIRLSDDGNFAYITPLQPFDHAAVTVYCKNDYEGLELSVGILISTVNHSWEL